MANHYSYRVDHDLGFAPHINGSVCAVCGCKITTIERWAKKGSWVVGIGGNGTGKPNTLIYAMRVDETPEYAFFKKQSPRLAKYLNGREISPTAPVLVSKHFYYFGTSAQKLPQELAHIVKKSQGCKKICSADIETLQEYLSQNYKRGKHGEPNNGQQFPELGAC